MAPPTAAADQVTRAPGEPLDGTWLARELHDGVVQCLTTTLIGLEVLRRDGGDGHEAGHLVAMQADVRAGLTDLRELVSRLRGAPTVDHGLVESLDSLVQDLRLRSGIDATLVVSPDWPAELPIELARQLRRIVQEALVNVRLHAAASTVRVTLDVVDGHLQLTVADDGRGHPDQSSTPHSYGLLGMRERAVLLGASLEIDGAADRGTNVVVTLDAEDRS
jgi:two-component system sensor histidine kinase UhpB